MSKFLKKGLKLDPSFIKPLKRFAMSEIEENGEKL